jgi:hypothetical protein
MGMKTCFPKNSRLAQGRGGFSMKTELPTKPGPYYWREKDGDEWELWHVLDNGSELTAHRGFNVAFLPDLGGQWLPIPPAEELVELLWRVHNVLDDPSTIELRHLGEYINKLRKGKQ